MSIKAEKKQQILSYMLEHIDKQDPDFVAKTVSNFEISKTTVYNYLKQMVSEDLIEPSINSKAKYELKETYSCFEYDTSNDLEEDRIFNSDILPLISGYPINVVDITRYVFTEMMNNAIEHSNASKITCAVFRNCLNTKYMICDDGIGIFRKIQLYFEQKGEKISLDEAVDALFPGKLTTDNQNHSGQGIFFSSHAADIFSIYSDNKVFSHSSFKEGKIDVEIPYEKGTIVFFVLANSSQKKLVDVFDMFSDPTRGFFKTQIPVAHMFSSGSPVSRSEARRLGTYIKNFEEVTLDFKDVPSVGQAFVHELFVKYQNRNPSISISVVNANDAVSNMISMVKNTKYE